MARIRPELRMARDEVRAFLDQHQTLMLATVDDDGAPHVAPVFYARIDDNTLAFMSATDTRHARHLRHEPRVSGVVEDGDSYATIRAVQFAGRTRFLVEDAEAQRIAEKLARRLAGDELPDSIENWIAPGRIVIVIDLEHIVSWDHTKR